MAAPPFASAPFRLPVMQALSVGSVYGGKQGPNAGLAALRCVVMHFDTHLLLDPVNLLRALPAPDSHFSKSLVNVAWPVVATRHRPAAAMVTTRSRSSMGSSLPLLLARTVNANCVVRRMPSCGRRLSE